METNDWGAPSWTLDGHQIKTPGGIARPPFPEKSFCHALEMLPLLRSHGFFRLARTLLGSTARFHFNKSKHRTIVTHQIDFALIFGNFVIPCDEDVAVAPQIPVSIRLAANSRAPRSFLRGFIGTRFGKPTPRGQMQYAEYRP